LLALTRGSKGAGRAIRLTKSYPHPSDSSLRTEAGLSFLKKCVRTIRYLPAITNNISHRVEIETDLPTVVNSRPGASERRGLELAPICTKPVT
jgi:hypothetical protein